MTVDAPPPAPAESNLQPLIFISYSSRDADRVYPIIDAWRRAGRQVWYDRRIRAGNAWYDDVTQALLRSHRVVVFITVNSVASQHVGREVFFALEKNKAVLPVYLEDTVLPEAWQFWLGRVHALFKHRMSESSFDEALATFLKDPGAAPSANEKRTATRRSRASRGRWLAGAGAGITLVATLLIMFALRSPVGSSTGSPTSSASPLSGSGARTELREVSTVAGLLRFVPEGDPLEGGKLWLQLDKKRPWGFGLPIAEGIIVWHETDGTRDRLIVHLTRYGNACAGAFRYLVVRKEGLEKMSADFGTCRRIEQMKAVAGGLDIMFVAPLLKARPIINLRGDALVDEAQKNVELAFEKRTEIWEHVGEHPSELMRVPSILARAKSILGGAFDTFLASLAVGSPSRVVDDWIIGSAGMPKAVSKSASVLFISAFSDEVVIGVLRDRIATLYGVSSPKKPPKVVTDWIAREWKPKATNIAR